MINGVLRKPQPGTSQLGGIIRVFIYTVSQFAIDTIFPIREDIVGGEIATLPILPTPQDDAARIFFDVKDAKWTSSGTTTATQFSFLHGIEGKVAGYTREKHVTIDEYMGEDLLAVAQLPNGDRLFLGQTGPKSLRMQISDDGGNAGGEYIGSTISLIQQDVVDFRPPFLADDIVIKSAAMPAYA